MEQHLGRPLTREEVVHHINHSKTDNRLENLELMTNSQHRAHHNKDPRKPKSRGLREKIRQFMLVEVHRRARDSETGRFASSKT